MITHKDRQMGPTTMKSTRDTVNPKRGGMPQYDDSQISRNGLSSEEVHKRPDKLKDGGMPQCDDP